MGEAWQMTQSPIVQIVTDLVRLGAAEEALAGLTETELLALGSDWELWARPNQAIPPTIELSDPPPENWPHPWPVWGRTRPGKPWRIGAFIGTRGTGKTTPIARYVHRMAMTMEWPYFLLVAQGKEEAVKIFINAANGLVKGAPPWERPYAQAPAGGDGLHLYWPSGAEAVVTSAGAKPERGPEYYGAWCTELVDWPHAKRVDAWAHVQMATRAGDGHILVDSTPKRGHPILEDIKRKAETDPGVWWVRHEPRENALNLREGYYDDLERDYAGTVYEIEELKGLESEGGGLVKMGDIEATRRELASLFKRRIVVMDPTGADPKRSQKVDTVGLMEWGLCLDDQLMPLADETATMHPEEYAAKAVVMYIRGKCDCMVIETDRGGVLPTSMVRAAARDISALPGEEPTPWLKELREALNGTAWRVEVVDVSFRTRYQHGTIYVREVRTWADRPTRASLLGQLYHQHRVSHPRSVNLDSYETTITTHEFKPREKSPGDLDCGTWAIVELLGKYQDLKMGKGQGALNQAAREQQAKPRPSRRVEQIHPTIATARRADTRGRI
jgi:phage terminase large subunit-like protein